MMDAHMNDDEAPDLLSVVDDACLCAVLAQLPTVQDLLVASAVCKRLQSAARTSALWIKHVYTDFGICITTQSPAAAGTSAHAEEGAMLLYKQLAQAQLHPRALPAEALCTDGGCDEPYYAYWAGNMFVPKRSIMYCSEANTRNIHIFARLCPDSAAMQEQQQPPSIATAGNAPLLPLEGAVQDGQALPQQHEQQKHSGPHAADPLQDAERKRREFLLNRCPHSAKHLISPKVVARYHPQQQQQEVDRGRRGGVMQRLYMHMGWARSADDKMAAAIEALQTCSTEGLAQFFLAAYMGQQLSTDWSLALFSNLNDEQIQYVHEVAFSLWTELADNPKQHKFLQLPLPPPHVTPSTAAAAAAADMQHPAERAGLSQTNRMVASSPTPASHRQQLVGSGRPAAAGLAAAEQHAGMRQLLCDERQLCALTETTRPGQNLCIVGEIILARDDDMSENSSTCPVGSGMVFLGNYQHTGDAAAAAALGSGSSMYSPPSPRPGSDAKATADAAATAKPAARQAAAALAAMTYQPWIAASNDLTTAAAVITAAHAGLLPPIADYVKAGAAAYIEFAQPSREQLRQQQHEWARLAGASQKHASSSSSNSTGCWPGPGFMVPVLWFRFPPTPVQAEEEEEGGGGGGGGDDDAVEELGELAAFLLQGPQQDQAKNGDSDSEVRADGDPDEVHIPTGEQLSSEGLIDADSPAGNEAAVMAAAQERHMDQLEADESYAAGTSSAAAAAAAAVNTVELGSAAAAAAVALQARAVPAQPTCPKAATLPAAATEVAAALGWLPSWEQHPSMIHVPLSRPRVANLMCVKLLDCEDLKPAFNRSWGGCNIDMQLVMLRGSVLGKLPTGLAVAPVREWHV